MDSSVSISRQRSRAPGCETAELAGTSPNESSGVTAQVAVALDFREFADNFEFSGTFRNYIPHVAKIQLLDMHTHAVQVRLDEVT